MSLKEVFFGHRRGAEFYPSSQALGRLFEEFSHKRAILGYFSEHSVPIKELFRWPEERPSGLLSDIGILRHFVAGNITIDPFNIERLQSNGYDVCLGGCYFTYSGPAKKEPYRFLYWKRDIPLYNPLDEREVALSWGTAQRAKTVRDYANQFDEAKKGLPREMWTELRFFEGYNFDDQIVVLEPGQMILCHTVEFIGGRNIISTTISGKSTLGRNMAEVCNDANLGDIGFISRWTLELKNKSQEMAIVLLVGQPVATVQFTEVEQPIASYQGAYQSGKTIEQVKTSWRPENMLPKMRRNL